MPAKPPDGADRGLIIPIGGAENKLSNPAILEGFIEVCGGTDAHIAIIVRPVPEPEDSTEERQ